MGSVPEPALFIDVLVLENRGLAATRLLPIQALDDSPRPYEVSTDRGTMYPRTLGELLRSARHVTDRYTNNAVGTDHGAAQSRLRPMCGLERLRSA